MLPVKDLTPRREGVPCFSVTISPDEEDTLKELVQQQLDKEHEFAEPSVIEEQPTAECLEVSNANEAIMTRRTELPVMEISIENEVEVTAKMKNESSPNIKVFKSWPDRHESPMSLAPAGINSTLLTPVQEEQVVQTAMTSVR